MFVPEVTWGHGLAEGWGQGVCVCLRGGGERASSGRAVTLLSSLLVPSLPLYNWLHLACIIVRGARGVHGEQHSSLVGREPRMMAQKGLSAHSPGGLCQQYTLPSPCAQPKLLFVRFNGGDRRCGGGLGRRITEEHKGTRWVNLGQGIAGVSGRPGGCLGTSSEEWRRGGQAGGRAQSRQPWCVWWERKSLCCRPITLQAEQGGGCAPPALTAEATKGQVHS